MTVTHRGDLNVEISLHNTNYSYVQVYTTNKNYICLFTVRRSSVDGSSQSRHQQKNGFITLSRQARYAFLLLTGGFRGMLFSEPPRVGITLSYSI